MIKVGNVWYPRSQRKLAIQVARWRHKAIVTEMRKRKTGRYGTYKRNNSSNRVSQESR